MFFFVNFNYFKKEIKNLYIMLVDFKSIIWYTKLLSKDIEKLEKYMKTYIKRFSQKKREHSGTDKSADGKPDRRIHDNKRF